MFENWSTIKKLIWLKYLAAKVKEILYTLSGSSPLSFDQAVAKPMEHLITNIKPVQNLNGYDSPWPGGGGTNKLPMKEEYIVLYRYINNNGEVLANNNNFYVDYYIPVTPDTEYNITITTPISYCSIMEYDENKTFITRNLFECTGSTEFVTETQIFTTTSNTKYVLFGANLDTARVSLEKILSYKYQLQTGNFTGFTPYENICPVQGWKTITAWDDAKLGRNIEWNQLIPNGNFADGTNGWEVYQSAYGSIAASDGILTFTANNSGSGYLLGFQRDTSIKAIPSHKYIYSANAKFSVNGVKAAFEYGGAEPSGVSWQEIAAGIWTRVEYVFTAASNMTGTKFMAKPKSGALAVGDTMEYSNIQLFDLTQMFGAGNEPTTVEEFRALFPNDYYPYNAGEHTCVGAVNGEPYRKVPVTFGALGKNLGHIGTDNFVSGQRYTAEYKNGGVVITSTDEYGRAGYSIPVKAGNQYTISLKAMRNGNTYAIQFNDSNEFAYNYWVVVPNETMTTYSRTITATSDILFVGIYPNAVGTSITVEDFQLELGSSASSYEPYNDTVYGGTFDLVTGDGAMTHTVTTYTKFTGVFGGTSRGYYAAYISMGISKTNDTMCNEFKYSASGYDNMPLYSYVGGSGSNDTWTFILPNTITSKAEADAWAEANPIEIYKPLSTPIPFHIDGVSVTPLEGKNNVWTDCGDTLSVTYISRDVSS